MAANGCRLREQGQALSYMPEKPEEATKGPNAALGLAREAMKSYPRGSRWTISGQDTTHYC